MCNVGVTVWSTAHFLKLKNTFKNLEKLKDIFIFKN